MTSTPPAIQERTPLALISRRLSRLVNRKPSSTPAARRTLGVALIGVGNVARWLYLPRLQKPGSGFSLKAVHDVDAAACSKVAGAFHAASCASVPEVINTPGVEVVLICTPTPFHCAAAISALDAGRHVLCEKPLGRTVEEAMRMRDAAVRAQRVGMVNFSYRFRPDLMFAGDIIRSGILGSIHQIWGSVSQGNWFDAAGAPAEKRVDAAAWKYRQDGGVALDLGPHLLDLCRSWLGEVSEVQAWTESLGRPEPRSEAACGISLRFRSGARAQLLTSRLATGSVEQTFLETNGSLGALRVDSQGVSLWTRQEPRWRRLMVPQNPPDFLATFHNAIVDPSARVPDFEDGLRNNELIDAVYASASGGKTITLEPAGAGRSGVGQQE